MFNRKKREIEKLKYKIQCILWEWEKEKELYNQEMKERILEQKVDWVIGGIDVERLGQIHRPIYNLTKEESKEIAELTQYRLKEKNIKAITSYHWNKTEECFVIDVQVYRESERKMKNENKNRLCDEQ